MFTARAISQRGNLLWKTPPTYINPDKHHEFNTGWDAPTLLSNSPVDVQQQQNLIRRSRDKYVIKRSVSQVECACADDHRSGLAEKYPCFTALFGLTEFIVLLIGRDGRQRNKSRLPRGFVYRVQLRSKNKRQMDAVFNTPWTAPLNTKTLL